MAVAGLITQGITVEKTVPPGTKPIFHAPEGASQAYLRGAPLIFSSGKLVVAASPPFDTGDSLAGIAMQNATGVTDSDVAFIPVMRNIVFEATLENSSVNGHTIAQTDLGLIFAIDYDATAKLYYVDFANTTNPIARVIKLVDAIGVVRGRVQFVFTGGTIY